MASIAKWTRRSALLLALIFALAVCPLMAADKLECSVKALVDDHLKYAEDDSILATLSLAAYLDHPPQIVHNGEEYRVEQRSPESGKFEFGLAYVVYGAYAQEMPSQRVRTVVAFRGTEFSSAADWLSGNMPVFRHQYRLAERRMRDLIENRSNEEVIFTGHSLGGGIAVTLSRYFRRAKTRAVAFNGSPVLGCIFMHRSQNECHWDRPDEEQRWRNLYESGDPTRIVGNLAPWRWNWLLKNITGNRDRYYYKYNFIPHAFISDHAMATLAFNLACNTATENGELMPQIEQMHCMRESKTNQLDCAPSGFELNSVGNSTPMSLHGESP